MRSERGRRGPGGTPNRAPAGGPSRRENIVAEISKRYGLPADLARLVAAEQISASDAIERLARRDRVEQLIKQHNLDRALATQIALEQVRLEDVLARLRIQSHLETNRDREVFEDARASGKPIVLALHGHRTAKVTVLAVRAYEVDVREEGAAADEMVHKTRVKYAYDPEEYKKLKKAMEFDKGRRDQSVEPRLRPQDRFACSNRRLGAAMDAKRDVRVTTVEGEVFTGKIARVSRYELALRTRQGAEVVILRHAVDDFAEE